MKRYVIALLVMTGSLTLFGCSKNASEIKGGQNAEVSSSQLSSNENSAAEVNHTTGDNRAPGFTLVDTKGKKVSLSDYKGKIVILDFWATWCPPCRKGIPDLIDIQKKYKNKVVIIGISVDTDTKDKVPSFIRDIRINYTVLYATPEVVQSYGNIEAIPTSFVIDKKGKIVNQFVGLTSKETYIDEIKKLLGKS